MTSKEKWSTEIFFHQVNCILVRYADRLFQKSVYDGKIQPNPTDNLRFVNHHNHLRLRY